MLQYPYIPQTPPAVATEAEWRVADACNRAIWPFMLSVRRSPKWLLEGRVDFQYVDRLCRQLALQGLAPADLDHAEGYQAIRAIADVIMVSDDDPTRVVIHDEIEIVVPTEAWRDVMLAAHHLLWSQPKRYEVAEWCTPPGS